MTTTVPPPGKPSSAKTIRNPRRLLILSPTSHSTSIIPPLLHSLTGVPVATPPSSAPTPDTQTQTHPDTSTSPAQADPATTSSFAGYTTHPPLRIENRYYKAEVPIWVDEVPLDSPSPSTGSSATPSNTQQQQSEPTTEDKGTDDDLAQSLTPAQWKTAFSGAEAQVVRDAVGAVVICVRNFEPDSTIPAAGAGAGDVTEREDVRALKEFVGAILSVRELIEEERGGLGEVPGVVVLVGRKGKGGRVVRGAGESANAGGIGEDEDGILGGSDEEVPFSVAWWEDQLYEMGMMGLEVVSWDPREEEGETRNQFGEYQGMRRIREVLETHDWTDIPDETTAEAGNMDDDDLERHLLGLDEEDGFDLEVNELEREMVGLRFAIERGGEEHVDDSDVFGEGDDELDVDAVEALLSRMKAIKDMSDELPEEERKRFAAKAVRDIMKDI